MGFLVLGWVLTPSGQHSVPVHRAARKARQKSSSCCRLLRIIRSSSAVLDTLSFHLIMTPSPYHPFTRTYRRCGSSLCCSILTSRALMATLLRRVLQLNCTKTVLPLLLRWTTDISACRVFRLSPNLAHLTRDRCAAGFSIRLVSAWAHHHAFAPDLETSP
jgi:hypothetical protein